MKRVAVFVVAAVALVLLGLPPVLGVLTQSRVTERIAALDGNGGLQVSLRSYERGWFRSRALIAIGLAPPVIAQLDALGAARGMEPFAATLDRRAPVEVEIAHGPLAVLDGVYFGWSKFVARLDPQAAGVAALERSLGVPYVFVFRGRTDFFGGVAFDAQMPPVDLTIEGARVEFSGADLAGTLAGAHLVSDTHLDRFALTSPPGAVTVRNVRVTTDSVFRSAYVVPGDTSLAIEQFSIVDAARGASPVFDASNVRVANNVVVDPTGALLDVHASYDVESLFVDGTRIAGASLGVALAKIDIVALETFLAANRAQASGAAPPANLKPMLARALAAGPSVVLDPVRFTVNEEPFTARVEIAADPAALPAGGAFDPEDPAAVLPALRTVATLDVSKKLAREIAVLATELSAGDNSLAPEQQRVLADAQAGLVLVTLVSQGILKDAGETYSTELRLANGSLTLNGAPLPFGLPQ